MADSVVSGCLVSVEAKLLKEMAKLEAGIITAMERGIEPVIFIECNHPGLVYVGTQEDFDCSRENGYQPVEVNCVPVDRYGEEYGQEGCYVYRAYVCRSLKDPAKS